MARLGDFLGKQGYFLLNNNHYAMGCIAIFALLPFATWLSTAIIALITLRKGWLEGITGLLVAIIVFSGLSLQTMSLSAAFLSAAMAFLPCYLTAVILHLTASWRITCSFVVLQALLVLLLIHWLVPDFIMNQFHYVQAILKEIKQENSNIAINTLLNGNKGTHKQEIFANYIVGVQFVSIVLSAITSLTLARSIQSRLFYPGGFRQEMLNFRASSFGVILLSISAIGAYQYNLLAISCLPILVIYYVCAGLSWTFYIWARNGGFGLLFLLVILFIFVPFVMLPVYTVLGALDSLFNLRSFLSFKADKKV